MARRLASPRAARRRRHGAFVSSALAALSLLLLSPIIEASATAAGDAAPATNSATVPAIAGTQKANETTVTATPSSSLSSSPFDPALRALASSLANPRASSVFLANSRRNFTAEALAIQKEYRDMKTKRNRTGGGNSSSSSVLSLPRPNATAAAATQTNSFAASGRLPATYGISETAMEPATQVGFQACSITLSADPPSASACSPVTLSAKVQLPGGSGAGAGGSPASGVVVFGDNGVALGPPTALSPDGTAGVRVTSLLPGKHNLVAWYLRCSEPGASCNEGFSAPLVYSVSRVPALVTVRASPASLSAASSSNGTAAAPSTCSLKSVAFDVAVGAPGGVRDCATPGGVVALYLVKGRLSSVGSWSGPLLLQAKESAASASSSAAKSATGGASSGGGVFRSQAKKKATDALVGAATSAADSVARIFAKQVGQESGDGAIASGSGYSTGSGGVSIGGLDLGRAVASAKAAAAALSAVSGGGGATEKSGDSSSSNPFAGLPAPLASAIASHLASQRPSSEEAREAAKTVVAAAAADDESAEIATRAVDAAAAAEAADDRRVQKEKRAATSSSGSSSKPVAAAPEVAAPATKAAPAATAATPTPPAQSTSTTAGGGGGDGGGLFSHLPHLLPAGGGGGPLRFGRRSSRRLQEWLSDIQAAVASDPLLHRVLGAGLLLPTELAPGAPSHAALGAAKLKFGVTPPGQYTLVAQYSGDSRFEKASGIVPFDIDASCGFFT